MNFTAFKTSEGLYEYLCMPMGITNGPAYQQIRLMEEVLKRLREHGLTLKGSKCHMAYDEIVFLGFVVGHEGIKTDPAKIEAIIKLARPYNVKTLQQVLGTFNFYSRFVKNYADIIKPLTMLLKHDVKFTWGYEQQNAFDEVKSIFQDPCLLVAPDYSRSFYVFSDASDYAIGGFVTMSPDGNSDIIGYFSRTLTKIEQAWTTYEKEAIALIEVCEKYSYILQGRRFVAKTDNQPLVWIMNVKKPSPKIQRWRVRLAEFDFELRHVPGKYNYLADTLSRAFPCEFISKDDEFDSTIRIDMDENDAGKTTKTTIIDLAAWKKKQFNQTRKNEVGCIDPVICN